MRFARSLSIGRARHDRRTTGRILADHLDIVKPASPDSETYVAFLAAYKNQFGAAAQPIRMALAGQRSPILRTAKRELRVANLASETILLKQVRATPTSIEVGCGEEKTGQIEVPVDLASREMAVEVHPEIANAGNLASYSAFLIRFDGETAVVGYKIRGPDRAAPGCTAGGRGDIVVNFVVSRRRAIFDRVTPAAQSACCHRSIREPERTPTHDRLAFIASTP